MWTGGCATMTVSAVRDPAGTLAFACIVHSSLLSPSPSPGSYLEAGYKCYHLQKWARISHSFLGAKLGSELQFTQSTRDTELLWTEAVDRGGGRRQEPGCPVALCAGVAVASAARRRPPGWLVQTRGLQVQSPCLGTKKRTGSVAALLVEMKICWTYWVK